MSCEVPARDGVVLDETNEDVRHDVLQIISQHLQEEGFPTAAHALRAEANVHDHVAESRKSLYRRILKHIPGGEWNEVERILNKQPTPSFKKLQYAVAKQQFLEQVDSGDGQKAFSIMRKKLKSLESQAPPGEFSALSYLLSCSSVHEAPSGLFNDWREDTGRQQLVAQLKHFLEPNSTLNAGTRGMMPRRLWHLLRQASGYQVQMQKVRPTETPVIATLATDYQAPICPNYEAAVLQATSSLKCCAWLKNMTQIGCGGGNGTISVWSVDQIEAHLAQGSDSPFYSDAPTYQLHGHYGRIWSLAALRDNKAASGCSDGAVRIWELGETSGECKAVLTGHSGDVYSVGPHPDGVHIVTGGFDNTVRLFDAEVGKECQLFVGHTRPVTSVRLNHYGNIAITGSKDGTVKLWDVASGVCLQTIKKVQTGAAVSSVDLSREGSTLLVGYQDSSNRLWDLSTSYEPLLLQTRLQGHANTSRNLIKSVFGPANFVFGGSEDGSVCIWSAKSGHLVSRLSHTSLPTLEPVYDARWNQTKGMLATCSNDQTVRIWSFDPSKPYVPADC
ncbi:COMPASS-like H3K4 histone methylase component WDR5A [Diplonema papillatum]|nr:COMPASS-like H3K4 histone methylase component WDR5A [Diplonema papillatum]